MILKKALLLTKDVQYECTHVCMNEWMNESELSKFENAEWQKILGSSRNLTLPSYVQKYRLYMWHPRVICTTVYSILFFYVEISSINSIHSVDYLLVARLTHSSTKLEEHILLPLYYYLLFAMMVMLVMIVSRCWLW